jgi:hypothetical protein
VLECDQIKSQTLDTYCVQVGRRKKERKKERKTERKKERMKENESLEKATR